MPAVSDIVQFLRGQLFTSPSLPNTSFAGNTVIITGANQGLGFQCAKQLLDLHVSTLILGCRDVPKGEAAREGLLVATSGETDIQVWKVDMAGYASVKSFAGRVERELIMVDALIADAAFPTNKFHLAEGLEETLVVNLVSTFLLSSPGTHSSEEWISDTSVNHRLSSALFCG
ncbi:Putative short-chain dehydrogenase/reductase SDR, NAD(P)-binding domain superfamily [Septoria linicola]|uniref:Short-chain dehydrogenase/reductase SDR, NAD(P)-binding domain superfamily n=1 Tax=Septoria linicola TaxID=215465 RepID=A0A9Q9ANS8_9PEZI|nr:putative short-chain dehydrogenase/reductase SDR, NAD(P)-binding domain superfamily [Septoria linicola]USW49483.1 Putative short-chain dehydrogenase/reductase SDR, NAD(P)-binding domain superfamily [Septoria linicola]